MTDHNSLKTLSVPRDRRMILSTLWIFATLNYIYCDVFSLFFDKQGLTQSGTMSAGSVLFFAVVMETGMAMVVLSRVLPRRSNRWSNGGTGLLLTAVEAWSLVGGTPTPFYIFFAAVEIAATLFIIWYAWTWRDQSSQSGSRNDR